MKKFFMLFVLLLSVFVHACSNHSPAQSFSISIAEENHVQLHEVLSTFSSHARLIEVEEYETLDRGREAFLRSFRDDNGKVVMVSSAVVDDGNVEIWLYEGLREDLVSSFTEDYLPMLRALE